MNRCHRIRSWHGTSVGYSCRGEIRLELQIQDFALASRTAESMVNLNMRNKSRSGFRIWGTGPTVLAVFLLLLCPHATEGASIGCSSGFLDPDCSSSEAEHDHHNESHQCVFDHAHSHHFMNHSNQEISCKPYYSRTFVNLSFSDFTVISGVRTRSLQCTSVSLESPPLDFDPLVVNLRL